MNGWFIAILVLNILSLGIHLGKHGKPRTDKYNFWAALVSFLLVMGLVVMAIAKGF